MSLKELVEQTVSDYFRDKIDFMKELSGSYKVYTTGDIPSQDGYICKFFTQDESRYISLCIEPQPYNPDVPLGQQSLSTEIIRRIQTYNQILSTFKFTQ